jgi:hypothetical protein
VVGETFAALSVETCITLSSLQAVMNIRIAGKRKSKISLLVFIN